MLIKKLMSKMDQLCKVFYSPFIRCGNLICGRHDGKEMCFYHLIRAKREDECSICLHKLTSGNVILLACGHMFHCECMSCCRKPQCPLCRKQLEPIEAMATVGQNTINSMALQLYSLPVETIKTATACIDVVLRICKFAPKELYNVLKILL